MIGQSRRTHKRSGFVSRFGSPAAPPGFIGSHRSPQREEVPNGGWMGGPVVAVVVLVLVIVVVVVGWGDPTVVVLLVVEWGAQQSDWYSWPLLARILTS